MSTPDIGLANWFLQRTLRTLSALRSRLKARPGVMRKCSSAWSNSLAGCTASGCGEAIGWPGRTGGDRTGPLDRDDDVIPRRIRRHTHHRSEESDCPAPRLLGKPAPRSASGRDFRSGRLRRIADGGGLLFLRPSYGVCA
jgi:hypothetical protein